MLIIVIDHEAWDWLAGYQGSQKSQLSCRTFNWIQVTSPSRVVHTTQFCHCRKLIKLKLDHCSQPASILKGCFTKIKNFTARLANHWIKKSSQLHNCGRTLFIPHGNFWSKIWNLTLLQTSYGLYLCVTFVSNILIVHCRLIQLTQK